jgi:hypothetical protein
MRWFVPLVIAAGLVAASRYVEGAAGYGTPFAFSLWAGAAFGLLLQRARFCFFCILRELFEERNGDGALGILAALAVGSIGYTVIAGAWLPDPAAGRLPADAHIGPASWVVAVGGLVFGAGMTLSGSCISAHLYRLGEGSLRAPFALAGAIAGFALGFLSWDWLYREAIAEAPLVWLPASLGHGGALLLQLAVLATLALAVLRFAPPKAPAGSGPAAIDSGTIWHRLTAARWPAVWAGTAIGILGVLTFLRVGPLGVTAELGSLARSVVAELGLLQGRLIGLDAFAGCRTEITRAISENGVFVLGLIAASFAAAVSAGQFRPQQPTLAGSATALLGGVLLGWGAMVALGCTVGTLLSGISALAVSGWLFAVGVVAGVWLSLAVKRRLTHGAV